jgi:trehalose 6-phosphate phosphatase
MIEQLERQAPAVFPPNRIALFLDLDGTLAEFSDNPRDVRVDADMIRILHSLHAVLDGALALISGRRISELDRLLYPLQLPCAGGHGLERRDAAGIVHRLAVAESELHPARVELAELASTHPGLLLEDKGNALAVHFRTAPQLKELVYAVVPRIVAPLSPRYELMRGDMVLEIKPSACDKGTALEAFMAEGPYKSRMPVFVGDDLTDYDAFGAVRRHSGMTVAVGERITAQWYLPDPAAVRTWLTRIVKAGGGDV